MAKRSQSKGKCFYCGNSFAKGGMSKHLKTCEKRQDAIQAHEKKSKAKPTDIFYLTVEGSYTSYYWLHLEISANLSLSSLDNLLRDIWLECCGHMSMFEINGANYSVAPMAGFGDRSMSYTIGGLLDVGVKFNYEYDFGSTTELKLRVVDKRQGKPNKNIGVMARNLPPEILCQTCNKKPATLINIYAEDYETGLWFCDDCAPEEDESEIYYQPNVNSPRVGVCAYEGSMDEDGYAT